MKKDIKIFAIASGGGHWKQLMKLKECFGSYQVMYVTSIDGLPQIEGISEFYIVSDFSRSRPFRIIPIFIKIAYLIFKFKPTVIITTGAAPGLVGIVIGRFFNIKTLWIDSMANADSLSLSGKIARLFTGSVVSQWQHVADKEGVSYWGKLL